MAESQVFAIEEVVVADAEEEAAEEEDEALELEDPELDEEDPDDSSVKASDVAEGDEAGTAFTFALNTGVHETSPRGTNPINNCSTI